MSFSFQPLWDLLEEENISKMEFASAIKISNTTLAKLSKNEPVNLSIIDKICNLLHCRIEDVVQHIPNIVLTPLQTGQPLDMGTIIMTSENINEENCPVSKYHVIVDQNMEDLPTGNAYVYSVAPIVVIPRSMLCKFFDNVAINGQLMHGWIDFSQLTVLPSTTTISLVGKMPDHITRQLVSFVDSIVKMLD